MIAKDFVYDRREHSAAFTSDYVFHQLIPYIGNKRKLLSLIDKAIVATGAEKGTFVDFFAGSSVVSRFAKKRGFRVVANDWEPYSKFICHSYIQCNRMPSFASFDGVDSLLHELNSIEPLEGYVTTHLCPKDDDHPDIKHERMFFTHTNGMKIDAIRERLQRLHDEERLSPDEFAVVIAAMMYSVSYVSNTSGVFKGFHRGWGGNTGTALYRILSEFELKAPVMYDNGQDNCSTRLDAQLLAEQMKTSQERIEIAYLDPPYNQHPYGSNYHVLNTVALWDKPDMTPQIEGRNKSAIRLDWRTERRSSYNHHSLALNAYQKLIDTIPARFILTSYSTDGNIPLQGMIDIASKRGRVSAVTNAYKRYRVSSQRFSNKPMNVEFILIVDTAGISTSNSAEALYNEILQKEEVANATHREIALDQQMTLF